MSDAQQHVKLSTRARVPTIIPRRNLHRKTRLDCVTTMISWLYHSSIALVPASAADPKRHLRAALIESRGDPTTLPAKEAIAALVALRPPAPPCVQTAVAHQCSASPPA